MGFFEKVGRRAERLKQSVSEAAEEGAMYECADCGKRLFKEQEACPACGSEAVVEREDLEGGHADPDTEDGSTEAAEHADPDTEDESTEAAEDADPDTEDGSTEAAEEEQTGAQEPDGTP